jgi:RimJ/RimL family protein N-acetyltransferase
MYNEILNADNLLNYKANSPEKINFYGKYIILEPLNALKHGSNLWHNMKNDLEIWKYLFYGPFERQEDFIKWLETAENNPFRTYYTCVHKEGKALGILSLMDVNLEHGRIEIGGVCFGKSMQRTRLSTESIFLLLKYAFEDLNMRRVEWRTNSLNEASKLASERFGFTFEGEMRSHMISKGQNRDTLGFSMLQNEWIYIKKSFEAWLVESNFDENEMQKEKLYNIIKQNIL